MKTLLYVVLIFAFATTLMYVGAGTITINQAALKGAQGPAGQDTVWNSMANVVSLVSPNQKVSIGGTTATSSFVDSGSLALKAVSKTASYTLTGTDYMVDFTANIDTAILPTAVGIKDREYAIKYSGNTNPSLVGSVRIVTTSSQLIDSNATLILVAGNCVTVKSNGVNWEIKDFAASRQIKYTPTTLVGWTTFTTQSFTFIKAKNQITIWVAVNGTSNSVNTNFSAPFISSNMDSTSANVYISSISFALNNGSLVTTSPYTNITPGAGLVNCGFAGNTGAWTASGTKQIYLTITYPTFQ